MDSRHIYDTDYMKALGRWSLMSSPSLGKQIVRTVQLPQGSIQRWACLDPSQLISLNVSYHLFILC